MDKGINAPFFKLNDRIKLDDMEITVLGIHDNWIKSIQCKFDSSLDDPSFYFLTWDKKGWKRIKMPGVGEGILI